METEVGARCGAATASAARSERGIVTATASGVEDRVHGAGHPRAGEPMMVPVVAQADVAGVSPRRVEQLVPTWTSRGVGLSLVSAMAAGLALAPLGQGGRCSPGPPQRRGACPRPPGAEPRVAVARL